MYEYKATILRVIDGDTVVASVALGFTVHVEVHFRLAGINAPEMIGATAAAGREAKEALASLLVSGPDRTIVVKSEKPLATDKYGRWLGRFYLDGRDINQAMIDGGFAVAYP